MPQHPNAPLPALAALTLATILWAGSFIAMKLAMGAFSPLLVVFGRMALAALVFLPIMPRLGGLADLRRDIRPILFMALCEPCLYFIFEANALRFTQVSQAGMVTSLLPLLVAATAAIVLKERLSRRTLFGLFLAVAGVLVLSATGSQSEAAPSPALGNFLEFLAMCCAVGYIVTLKKLSTRHKPLFLTAMQSFAGAIFFLPALFLSPLPEHFPLIPSLAVIFLGLGVTFVAYGLYNYGVSQIPAAKASVFINLIPVFTLLFSWLVLDEHLKPVQYAAAIVVLAGVFLTTSIGERAPPPPRTPSPPGGNHSPRTP
ncbi:DMT family transporter [Desulfolutivibrio sulfoxidireducens]|uniref:DMT family transporter n=1 Tax=Desulfolutivibrio sulfoxidireducens TaxID=2773299 RepID=UPI00159D3965|nr:DMT family transporter [Desulfolutivibrio sulfoxidireducens]QLA19659.1 EamA family transporter [Desulfolutivibrio sulfoxidireducens]